jgi:hypothetical protein
MCPCRAKEPVNRGLGLAHFGLLRPNTNFVAEPSAASEHYWTNWRRFVPR